MPAVAVPSVKLGVTVSPSCTAWFSVTVKVRDSPSTASEAPAFAIVTVALLPVLPRSSLVIVPVAVSVAVTVVEVPEMLRPTVKVSSSSTTVSSVVVTVKACVSPDVPAKARAAVFSV